jgi:3-deoxy-manno-octulosonate cytidylyltransferase (CMP-KDO synthetase)
MSAVAVIPARWGSTRFPGKALHPILGKPLLQHVWERCLKAKSLSQVIVATDDMRIAEAAFDFGAEVAMTSPKHPSGTDRIAEVAKNLKAKHLINVQGDEPALDPKLVDKLVEALESDPKLDMVTAACPFASAPDVENPNNVKVVTARDGRALYFSRSVIPHPRDSAGIPSAAAKYFWHIGVYGYRKDFLMQYVKRKPTWLEDTEKLEQLRALENGASIHVVKVRSHGVGVDTPADVARAEAILAPKRARK